MERFRLNEHALIYDKSGSLEIESPSGTLTIMPGQCIIARRLQRARDMLREGNLQVKKAFQPFRR